MGRVRRQQLRSLPFYTSLADDYAMLTLASVNLAMIMLFESSLSYLGLGIQSPAVSWGRSPEGDHNPVKDVEPLQETEAGSNTFVSVTGRWVHDSSRKEILYTQRDMPAPAFVVDLYGARPRRRPGESVGMIPRVGSEVFYSHAGQVYSPDASGAAFGRAVRCRFI